MIDGIPGCRCTDKIAGTYTIIYYQRTYELQSIRCVYGYRYRMKTCPLHCTTRLEVDNSKVVRSGLPDILDDRHSTTATMLNWNLNLLNENGEEPHDRSTTSPTKTDATRGIGNCRGNPNQMRGRFNHRSY